MTRHEGRGRWKRYVANDIRPRHSGTAGSLPGQSLYKYHDHIPAPPLTSAGICCYTALWRRQLFDVGISLTLQAIWRWKLFDVGGRADGRGMTRMKEEVLF